MLTDWVRVSESLSGELAEVLKKPPRVERRVASTQSDGLVLCERRALKFMIVVP